MTNYNRDVQMARECVTKTILLLAKKDANVGPHEIGQVVSELNKAWEELTDFLVRRCGERDAMIRRLLDELAERKSR